jgi:hypothetical protein
MKEDNTNEKIRKYIIDNYKPHIPDIEQHVNKNKTKQINFNYLGDELIQGVVSTRYQRLLYTIIDVRNNSDPIAPESNTIIKSDNNYANETKRMVRILISKGWSYDEIAFEMERIYGMGTIARFVYFDNVRYREYVYLALFIGISGFSAYRLIKPVYKFIRKKLF